VQDPAQVVRLGLSNVEVVNSQRYRIRQGMTLQLSAVSSELATVRAWARIRYDNGEDDTLFIPDQTLSNDRSVALSRPSDVARFDGWVTDALVELPLAADSVKRGQVYVRLFMDPSGPQLCKDYVYSNFGQVALGTYIQDGPGGGAGNLEVVTAKADGAPAASTSVSLAVSNEIRRIDAYIWYYHCSADVASRVIEGPSVENPWGALPTGFGAGVYTWRPANITLTANQDGIQWADEKNGGNNDAGAMTVATIATPFPMWVTEGNPVTIEFLTNTGQPADRDVIYLVRESWVMEL